MADTIGDSIRQEDSDHDTSPPKEIAVSEEPLAEDFATLRPIGHLAPSRFHELAERILADPNWQPHARRFIHIETQRKFSDTQTVNHERYTGHYFLNLSCLPLELTQGWVCGSGRADIPDHGGVDILLTLQNEDGVKGRHAQIFFHADSRMLMIKAVSSKSPRSIISNAEEIGNESYPLPHRVGITFGSLTYRLEFTDIDKRVLIQQRDELMKRHRFWSQKAPPSLDPTPSENHIILQGFHFHPPQAAGAYGVVGPCIDNRGDLYAAKRVHRTRSTLAAVRDEIEILRSVSGYPHICSLFRVLYSDGDESSMGSTSINDVWLVLKPWAPRTLRDVILPHGQVPHVVRITHQAIQALKHLHSHGITHRDIKPQNFLLDHGIPPTVWLADFGHSTRLSNSRDPTKGTISYLAPEISALKATHKKHETGEGSKAGAWSEKSDVFSLGVVAFELLFGSFHRPDKYIDRKLHERIQKRFDESPTMFSELIKPLVSWNAEDGPTSQSILWSPVWVDPDTPFIDRKRWNFM